MPPNFLKLRNAGDIQSNRVQDNVSATLGPVATALANTPIMGAPPPSWIRPALLSDFVNVGGGFALTAYNRDALGYVHSKGVVSTAAGHAAGTAIYSLPMGYRPSETQRFPVRGNAGAVQSVVISPNGLVACGLVIAAAGTIDLVFSFLAEQ